MGQSQSLIENHIIYWKVFFVGGSNFLERYSFLGSAMGERFCIEGVNLFRFKWLTVGECAIVFDPKTKKPYCFSVYQISVGDKKIPFVAGQRSDSTWLFFNADGVNSD
ncbi:MAG: hypothetical protein Q8876_01865 [Bacillota bacterium]|nr:hypothetical protein [Bacillota bacterium]